MPWEQAQAASVSQSLRLAGDLSAALGKANLPVVSGREPVRPLDNLECPAVAIELSPLPVAGSDATPVTDAEYQQRVASTLTTALQAWRNQVDPRPPIQPRRARAGRQTILRHRPRSRRGRRRRLPGGLRQRPIRRSAFRLAVK